MTIPLTPQDDFNEITQLIHAARQRAVQAVNTALIELYWQGDTGSASNSVIKERTARFFKGVTE